MLQFRHQLLYNSLCLVVLLGVFLVSQKLGVHSSGVNETLSLRLLDAVGVSLVGLVMRTGVLLLLHYLTFKYNQIGTSEKEVR